MAIDFDCRFAFYGKRAFDSHVLFIVSPGEVIAISRFANMSVQRTYSVMDEVQVNLFEGVALERLARLLHIPRILHIKCGPLVACAQSLSRLQNFDPGSTRVPFVVVCYLWFFVVEKS